ncbi:hypothetical protein SprV_0501824400 [Sparganum proliferum]
MPAPDVNATLEARRCQVLDAVHSTTRGVLGRARCQHQDWFDENDAAISNLLAEKNRLYRAYHNGTAALTLFRFMFSAMLMDAYRDELPGIRIAYRTDGRFLNSRQTKATTRLSMTTVHDLLIADACALNTTTEVGMRRSMDLFSAACDNFGLTINTDKTVFMRQPSPNAEYNSPQITVNFKQLQNVNNCA